MFNMRQLVPEIASQQASIYCFLVDILVKVEIVQILNALKSA